MTQTLIRFCRVLEIVGDIMRIRVGAVEGARSGLARFGDIAVVKNSDGCSSLAQVIGLNRDVVTLQLFSGTKGLSTAASVYFPGHPMQVVYSANIVGRVFSGAGEPLDGGPDLSADPRVEIGGPTVNPMRRQLASRMMRTNVPMIDLFNCLVESQKIPIFSVAGEA